MREFKLYIVGAGGAVEAVEELIAPNDHAAVVASSAKHAGLRRELWCGPRLLASWDSPATEGGAHRPTCALPPTHACSNKIALHLVATG